MRNVVEDALANAVARMPPLWDNFSIEILYNPSVLNNVTKLHIFYDDQQIIYFMANPDVFKDIAINEDMHEK